MTQIATNDSSITGTNALEAAFDSFQPVHIGQAYPGRPIEHITYALTDNSRPLEELAPINLELRVSPQHPSPLHLDAASPIHLSIVVVFGILALLCVGAGIYALFKKATGTKEINVGAARLRPGQVGVAFLIIGFLAATLITRVLLKRQEILSASPDYIELFSSTPQATATRLQSR